MKALQDSAKIADMKELALETGHSRFPVYRTDLDDIVGIAHVKDSLGIPIETRDVTPISAILQEAPIFPETRDLESLLLELRREHKQMAIIVDEYGGTAGIITIEDLIEEIVGEIEDEYDPDDETARVTTPLAGTHVLSGLLHPDEVEEISGFQIPEGDYETLAGFLLAEFERIPAVGDQVAHRGWELKVTQMERNRIAEVLVVSPPEDEVQG
jgi:CBS domain containing-hemolysin-like protein